MNDTRVVVCFDDAPQFRSLCKTESVFRLKDDPEGEYQAISMLYCPKVKAHIIKEHGDNLVEILNERYGQLVTDEEASLVRLRDGCQKMTIIKMKGTPPGSYSSLPYEFSPEVKQAILEKYGEEIEEFVNERFT